MEQKTRKREWVKSAAIVFLAILLVLTFFSNTIMNRSLPEVAAQQVMGGSINARIRGTGTVSANETYDVTINQSRKVQSVQVRVGDHVSTGDVLFVLDPRESAELDAARETLKSLEMSYQEQLTSISNEAARENREIQKAREAYNEALAIYQQFTSVDPAELSLKQSAAEAELKAATRALEEARDALNDAKNDSRYTALSTQIAEAQSTVAKFQSEIDSLTEQIKALYKTGSAQPGDRTETQIRTEIAAAEAAKKAANDTIATENAKITAAETEIRTAQTKLATDEVAHGAAYRELKTYAQGQDSASGSLLEERMYAYANDLTLLRDAMSRAGKDDTYITDEKLAALKTAYETITADEADIAAKKQALTDIQAKITAAEAEITACDTKLTALGKELQTVLNENASLSQQMTELQSQLSAAQYYYAGANNALSALQDQENNWKMHFTQLEALIKTAEDVEDAKREEVQTYSDAMGAASTLESTKQILEDLTFNASLGSTTEMNLQAAKDKIEAQKQLIEELSTESDAMEVKAKVSGTISAINVTAGNTIGAETPMATITITDRGYTIRISVTNEQAQKVRVGDTANVTNYYFGNISATLEKIANDPQNQGRGKLLIFRMEGEGVEPGTNLTLSIGQKSANYDTLVPLSAIRTDSNGSFVLVLTAKSTPLRTRYVATRVSVNVLAQDDTTAAVSGLVNGDFVITTSTSPIEAGDQVRLVDES